MNPEEKKPISPNPDGVQSHEPDDVAHPSSKLELSDSPIKKWIFGGVATFAVIFVLFKLFNHTGEETIEPVAQNTAQYHPIVKNGSQVIETATPDLRAIPKPEKEIDPEMQKRLAEKISAAQKFYQLRLTSKIVMYSGNPMQSTTQRAESLMQPPSTPAGNLPLSATQINALKKAQGQGAGNGSNEAFQATAEESGVTRANASNIPYFDETITEGRMIPGILQTAINSDLPGKVSANVSDDVYSNSGEKLLIPKGSLLIGQYNSSTATGQKRVFVMWTRLIRPDGVSVMLGSPGTDNLGTSGLNADVLQTHFWERFGQSFAFSVLGFAIANEGVSEEEGYNSASQYRMMMSNNFQNTANNTLNSTMNQKPTIIKYQGTPIKIFLARDLSFHDVENPS